MIISIEGNIGSGKSTLFKKLKHHSKFNECIFLDEPIDEWMENVDENGESILTKFYDNQEKYAFPFQIMSYFSKLNKLKNAVKNNQNKIIISERSIFTDKKIFAKMLHDDKKIDAICYNIYSKMFDEIDDFNLDKIIYINTTPIKCHERIHKRNRDGENNISIEYLEKCDKYHNDWLNCKHKKNIIELNGNEEFQYNDELFDRWVNQITLFLQS